MSRPVGKLKIIETRVVQKRDIAIYLTNVFEDENGKRWTTRSSAFLFDMKPLEPEAE